MYNLNSSKFFVKSSDALGSFVLKQGNTVFESTNSANNSSSLIDFLLLVAEEITNLFLLSRFHSYFFC